MSAGLTSWEVMQGACSEPLLASGGLPASWVFLAGRHMTLNLGVHLPKAFFLCVSVSKCSLFVRTPVRLEQGPPCFGNIQLIPLEKTVFPSNDIF